MGTLPCGGSFLRSIRHEHCEPLQIFIRNERVALLFRIRLFVRHTHMPVTASDGVAHSDAVVTDTPCVVPADLRGDRDADNCMQVHALATNGAICVSEPDRGDHAFVVGSVPCERTPLVADARANTCAGDHHMVGKRPSWAGEGVMSVEDVRSTPALLWTLGLERRRFEDPAHRCVAATVLRTRPERR